jgi:hypothetical protein
MSTPVNARTLRRVALVLEIAQRRAAMRESAAALREQLLWTRLALTAGRSLRQSSGLRMLALGAVALAGVLRKRD